MGGPGSCARRCAESGWGEGRAVGVPACRHIGAHILLLYARRRGRAGGGGGGGEARRRQQKKKWSATKVAFLTVV